MSAVASEAISEYTATAIFEFQADFIKQMATLVEKIDHLSERFSIVESIIGAAMESAPSTPIRDGASEEEIKVEIKKYFIERDGEILYPSDIAHALNIQYEVATRLICEMEENGQIRRAEYTKAQ